MTRNLTLVPAGAGSGKTWRIENTLAEWVETEVVAPGRILAVTFTEAAASELRERIRAELMKRGRITDALEIDRAYVGTIHALGQRLLTEHAFAASRSPRDRLLSEPERDLLIRRELAHSDALRPLMEDLPRFGYRWNPISGATAEEAFRADILRCVDLLRGLGSRGLSANILVPALQAIDAGYGERAGDGTRLTSDLKQAAIRMLARFPGSLAQDASSDAARKAFQKDFMNLRRAVETDALEKDWTLWQSLRTLRQSKRGSPTPEGYDALAEAVMHAAEGLLRHPGPLVDAKAHLKALITGAQDVLSAYQESKRQAGLIDYSDMIVETEALLRNRSEILEAVLAEIDCVVIDEFQDTNPVQFALLWQLARKAKRALIVGDTKQSIMGFQGADPRLSEALLVRHRQTAEPQDRNFRSDPRILKFVNTIGPGLFPEAYDALKAVRTETGTTALEAILLPSSWADRKNHTADCIADRITSILGDGEEIWDKRQKQLRTAQPADVAVLCYTSAQCLSVANALRARGLPVRVQDNGWLTSIATRAARAGLACIADPGDRHAALTWLTLGPPGIALQDAMTDAVNDRLDSHPELAPLRSLHSFTDERPVGDLVAELLRVTNFRAWVAGLIDPTQAMADIARFEAEAREFDRHALDLRAAAGFHGCGPQVFLGWIASQTEKDWNRHPDAAGWSGTGIEISTWHAAKGREWPMTFVSGLDFAFPARPGTLRTEFDRFDDLDQVLEYSGIGWLPDFAAPEKQQAFADMLIEADERDAARALYVALTRARDRIVLVLPAEPKDQGERPKRMVDLLRARTGLDVGEESLHVSGKEFAARILVEARDRDFPVGVRIDAPLMPRFGTPREMRPGNRTPWRTSPSSLEVTPGKPLPELEHAALHARVPSTLGDFHTATERGTAWHLAFRTLSERPELRDRLAQATGLNENTLDAIAMQAAAVQSWLTDQGYDRMHFELPLQVLNKDGSETNAIIDCLAEGSDGYLILDHKSGPCPDPNARFASYLPQLEAYADLISKSRNKPVERISINWMNEGLISACRYPKETSTR